MTFNDNFNIQCDEFSDSVCITYTKLREDTDYLDVTLAYEDRQQIGAHKVILSSSSPLFRDILKHHKHSHPMIVLRGIKSIVVK